MTATALFGHMQVLRSREWIPTGNQICGPAMGYSGIIQLVIYTKYLRKQMTIESSGSPMVQSRKSLKNQLP